MNDPTEDWRSDSRRHSGRFPKAIDHTKEEVTACLREWIVASNAAHRSPCSIMSCTPKDTAEWREYGLLSLAEGAAYSKLWMVTDFEYDEDGFREHAWNWRYWKVMARKCCWYQMEGKQPGKAGETMAKLAEAEFNFVKACGLTDVYKSSCQHIEEHFPNLKKS